MNHNYTAGLIHGEGSVMLLRNKPNEHRSPTISLTNTSRAIIDYLTNGYGGVVRKQKTYQDHHKQAWIWSLRGDKAIKFSLGIAERNKVPPLTLKFHRPVNTNERRLSMSGCVMS